MRKFLLSSLASLALLGPASAATVTLNWTLPAEDALLFENEKGVARASTAKVEVTCKGCKKFWMKF